MPIKSGVVGDLHPLKTRVFSGFLSRRSDSAKNDVFSLSELSVFWYSHSITFDFLYSCL